MVLLAGPIPAPGTDPDRLGCTHTGFTGRSIQNLRKVRDYSPPALKILRLRIIVFTFLNLSKQTIVSVLFSPGTDENEQGRVLPVPDKTKVRINDRN